MFWFVKEEIELLAFDVFSQVKCLSPILVDMSKGRFKQPMILVNEGTKKVIM